MNDTAKLALTVGTGMVIGKLSGASQGYWWVLGGLGLLFLVNSPGAQRSLSSGAKQVYSRFKK
jgi:hypothetical protein